MGKHNHAAFAREDVEDARRGEPASDLGAYAASRGLSFVGGHAPPNFGHVCPRHPEYCFNAMDGVLPGGAFGMLQHQLKEVPLVSRRGTDMGGPLFGERYAMWNFTLLEFFRDHSKPFAAQATWLPTTMAAVRVSEAALAPYLVIRPADRFSAAGTLDLGPHGLPGYRLGSGGEPDVGLIERICRAIAGPLSAVRHPFVEVYVDGGIVALERNGFTADPAELDALCQAVGAIATGVREACAPLASPRPFADALPAPAWADPQWVSDEPLDMLSAPWWDGFRRAAAERGMVLEDPLAYHRALPSLPVPGRAMGVMRGVVDELGPVRLAFYDTRVPNATRAAVVFATSAPDTPPGGRHHQATDQFFAVRDGLATVWNRTALLGGLGSADVLERALRTAAAHGLLASLRESASCPKAPSNAWESLRI